MFHVNAEHYHKNSWLARDGGKGDKNNAERNNEQFSTNIYE